jgi:hypothetical protein
MQAFTTTALTSQKLVHFCSTLGLTNGTVGNQNMQFLEHSWKNTSLTHLKSDAFGLTSVVHRSTHLQEHEQVNFWDNDSYVPGEKQHFMHQVNAGGIQMGWTPLSEISGIEQRSSSMICLAELDAFLKRVKAVGSQVGMMIFAFTWDPSPCLGIPGLLRILLSKRFLFNQCYNLLMERTA